MVTVSNNWLTTIETCPFDDISSYFNPFKPHLGSYNYPHLKHTMSSLFLTNQLTNKSSWSAVHTQYPWPARWLSIGSPFTGVAYGSGSGLIPSVMPKPPHRPWIVAGNDLKNHRLASQITISLSGILHPCSHATWETSQEVSYPKIAP